MPNPTAEERERADTADPLHDDTGLRNKLEGSRYVSDPRFCFQSKASVSLKITCYGSSSAKTPVRYLDEARLLGYILAKRGHVCINGAGSYGCMAAMNEGCHIGDGHVRGVIHEMFLVDNGYLDNADDTGDDSTRLGRRKVLEKRGSSLPRVFENATVLTKDKQSEGKKTENEALTPIREIYVAGGFLATDCANRSERMVCTSL